MMKNLTCAITTVISMFAAAVFFDSLIDSITDTQAKAAVPLTTINACTPDQLLSCINGAINGVNNNAVTCTTTGCTGPATGAVSSPPVITGTCATAGGGAGFSVQAGSSSYAGRIQCASTANTTLIATWPAAKQNAGMCVWMAETVAITLPMTSVTAALASFAYASTASPVFDYVCGGL